MLVGAHEPGGLGEHVVEVQQTAAALGALEVPVQLRSGRPGVGTESARGGSVPVLGDRQVAGLGPVDLPQGSCHRDRRPVAEIALEVLSQLTAQCRTVRQDLALGPTVVDVVLANLRERERVERPDGSHVVDIELPQA